jgi:hypothetical protein
MCAPSCVITYIAARSTFSRCEVAHRGAGVTGSALGRVVRPAFIVACRRPSIVAFAITLTAAVAYWTRFNPLWLFAAAGLLGYLGLV